MTLCGSATRIGLFAMGRQISVLRSTLASTLVFHLTALAMVPFVGPIGANWAHVAAASVWLAGLHLAYRKHLSVNVDQAVSGVRAASSPTMDGDLKSDPSVWDRLNTAADGYALDASSY